MATMGMLSGFFTMRAKSGSSMETPTKMAARVNSTAATRGRQTARVLMATKKTMATRVMKMGGLVRKLTTSLRAFTTAMASSLPLQGPRDAAVLAHAPEVHHHQDARHQGDAHAVQDVEAQQGRPAHEAPA